MKRSLRIKERQTIEASKYIFCGCTPVEIYGKENQGKYDFSDLRLTVDYDELENGDGKDFTQENDSPLKRLALYKSTKAYFDLDYCASARKWYKYKIMSDLYGVLWKGYDEKFLTSGETLVSVNSALIRSGCNLKKRRGNPPGINWDDLLEKLKLGEKIGEDREKLEQFAKAVAFIGNYMPVPTSHQQLLSSMKERYDKVLNLIKVFYYVEEIPYLKNDFVDEEIKGWLYLFRSWKNFVDENYLKGSFVDDQYEVISFDGTIEQLSKMLYNRSICMLKVYKERTAK